MSKKGWSGVHGAAQGAEHLSTDPVAPSEAATPVPATGLETYFLQLVNETRAEAGVAPLEMDTELGAAADAHSAWMLATDTFSHTGASGSSVGDRLKAAGYDAATWGENMAYVSDGGALDRGDVELLHRNLVNSPGHYANLVDADFTDIGIGLVEGDMGGWQVAMVTQDFATIA